MHNRSGAVWRMIQVSEFKLVHKLKNQVLPCILSSCLSVHLAVIPWPHSWYNLLLQLLPLLAAHQSSAQYLSHHWRCFPWLLPTPLQNLQFVGRISRPPLPPAVDCEIHWRQAFDYLEQHCILQDMTPPMKWFRFIFAAHIMPCPVHCRPICTLWYCRSEVKCIPSECYDSWSVPNALHISLLLAHSIHSGCQDVRKSIHLVNDIHLMPNWSSLNTKWCHCLVQLGLTDNKIMSRPRWGWIQ